MHDRMTLVLFFAVAIVAGIGISNKVYNAKVQMERNQRVKEFNQNMENGLKTTNRILDLVPKKSN